MASTVTRVRNEEERMPGSTISNLTEEITRQPFAVRHSRIKIAPNCTAGHGRTYSLPYGKNGNRTTPRSNGGGTHRDDAPPSPVVKLRAKFSSASPSAAVRSSPAGLAEEFDERSDDETREVRGYEFHTTGIPPFRASRLRGEDVNAA